MRDPRQEPRKGDVIRLPGDYRDREIASVTDSVCLMGQDRGRDIPMSYCSLSVWPKLAAGAQVIRVAPCSQHQPAVHTGSGHKAPKLPPRQVVNKLLSEHMGRLIE